MSQPGIEIPHPDSGALRPTHRAEIDESDHHQQPLSCPPFPPCTVEMQMKGRISRVSPHSLHEVMKIDGRDVTAVSRLMTRPQVRLSSLSVA